LQFYDKGKGSIRGEVLRAVPDKTQEAFGKNLCAGMTSRATKIPVP